MSRDAVKLAQTLIDSFGQSLAADGSWGPKSERAWKALSEENRAYINSRVFAVEGVSVDQLRNTRSVKRPSPARNVVSASNTAATRPPVKVGAAETSAKESASDTRPTYSGWRAAVAKAARAAGMSEATLTALLNQVQKETSGKLTVSEKHWYSPDWLRLNARVFRSWTDSAIRELQEKGEEAFFNTMYGHRKDLGNRGVASGDGYKYRGRGALQLTGRYNYEQVGKILGVNLVDDPDWITRNEENAVASAIVFLKMKGKLKVNMSYNDMAKLVNPHLA